MGTLYQVTPDIAVAILRCARQPEAALAVRAVDIPDAVACPAVELVRRALEANERRARTVDLIALLEARQQRIERLADGGQERVARGTARRLRDECGEHLLRAAHLARGGKTRRAGSRGRRGEAREIRGARLRAARQRNAAEPCAVLALAIVAANERRVPVAPTGKRREHRGEIGHVREQRRGHGGRQVGGVIAEGAGGWGGQGYGICNAWTIGQ